MQTQYNKGSAKCQQYQYDVITELLTFGKDYACRSETWAVHCLTRDDIYLFCRGISNTHQSRRPRHLSEFWIHPHKWQICHHHRSVLAAYLINSSCSSRCPHSLTNQHHRWPALSTNQSAGRHDTTLWLWPAVILYRSAFLQLNSFNSYHCGYCRDMYFLKIESLTVWW